MTSRSLFGGRAALAPQDVGIILSYLCAGGCSHCLYNCGPGWESPPISSTDLRAALEAVLLWPQPPQVHLTGGEPFLHFETLLEGARIAGELGVTAYVETSGSWCSDEDQARNRFEALREAGLEAVLVSCSPFHAERIPPARMLRAIRSALDVFGSERVIVYRQEFLAVVEQFDPEVTTPLSAYSDTYGRDEAARILWHGYGIISGGRSGYALGHLLPAQPVSAFAGEDCRAGILHAHHSHFDLFGNYISGFCGGLRVGDWHDLRGVIERFDAGEFPPLIEVLVRRGPIGLYRFARDKYEYETRADGYAGKCHLCVDVRRHLAQRGTFEELEPKMFYDQLC